MSPHDPMLALGGSGRPDPSREEAADTLPSPAIVITGMHRSGTSLIASAFELAGVNVGDRLIGRHHSNRRGHFEDIEFEEFHAHLLRRIDKDHLTVTRASVVEMTSEDVERAKALVERRRGRGLWGWKDPRTCLFLDFWHSLLANPRYVFVYRHPLEVVLSLFRRRLDVELVEVVTDPLTALEAWVTYNRAMLDFYRRHRGRCVLGHVDAVAADLAGAIAVCARRFGVEFETEDFSTLYHPAELTRRAISKEMLAEFARLAPLAARLYRQIDQAADVPQPSLECLDASQVPSAAVPDGARPSPETLAQEFELLLTRLEPRTVLAGRRALDELRRLELDASGQRDRGLAAHCGVLESRVAELVTQSNELLTQNTGLVIQNNELLTQNTGLVARNRELQAERAAADARADELARDRANLEAQLQGARRGLGAAQAQAEARMDTERLLAAIVQTRAWRAAQKWYAFKRAAMTLIGRTGTVRGQRR